VGQPPFRVQSVADLEARLRAERSGTAFVLFHDAEDRQQVVALPRSGDMVVAIGRSVDEGIRLDWDPEVSALHALLERVAGAWTIVDDGLSRNGTFVGGAAVAGRQRLRDGDVIRCGGVSITFRDGGSSGPRETRKAAAEPAARRLTPAQRRVLVALCRPLIETRHATPATNKAIARELSVSVDAVKTQLRRLSELLGVEGLPQNEKRAQLARTALESGLLSPRDLRSDGD
jgi:pSer/pThr/pTyr-binding forkhead associated (FHA) protein